jgi:two-component system CheB/CheR fusion protein
VRYLRKNPGEVDALFKELLIGVTNFFRDPDAFSALESMVIPALLESTKPGETIRIWVPGCSTGEEAYSIALLLENEMSSRYEDRRVQIFATDIDSNAINQGRRGLYPESISVDVPEKYLNKYFTKSDSILEIKKHIRDMLVFAEQNVARDPPFSKLDLISCRNMLIYMEPELQNKVIPLFHYALEPGGYMFLGSSESIGGHGSLFSTVDRKAKIFRSQEVRKAPAPTFGMAMPITDNRQGPEAIEAAKSKKPVGYREVMENLLLADYSPASILVDKSGKILFVHGRVGNYLETPPGDATLNIEVMAREGLRFPLSMVLRKAFAKNQEVRYERIRVESNGSVRVVDLVVRPIVEPPADHGLALVMFHDVPGREAEEISSDADLTDESRHRIAELEQELRSTKDYLETSNEELRTANEELKSTIEELQSSSEELQSTNEELETSREELQSINEELVTLNAALESKVDELGKTNDDMANLLASTEFGTVFLDTDLNVASFTPAAANTIHIVATDVGRPLSHIASNIDYPDLVEDVKQVLATLIPKVREARSVDGLWYSVRITPYRTTANVISGAVITFFDISDRKRLEAQSRLAAVVRDSNDAVTVQDLEGTILAWNKGAERVYGFSQDDALGMNISSISSESAYLEMKALMKELTRGEIVEPFETRRKTKDGRVLDVLLTATLLRDQEGRPQAIATTERDISEQRKTHVQLQQMTQMFRNALDPIVIEDMEGVVIDLNTGAERFYGWPRRGLVGREAEILVPPEHRDHVRELLEQCKRGEEVLDVEGTCQHKSGATFPVRVTLSRMIGEDGKTTGIATIARQRALESADVP